MPTRLGRYELLRELGRGGQAVVYEALDTELGRRVALKVPLPGARTEEGIRRFRREAQAAAGLRHANVAAIHDVGESGGRFYVAAELVQGGALRALIARRRLSAEHAVAVSVRICYPAHTIDEPGPCRPPRSWLVSPPEEAYHARP